MELDHGRLEVTQAGEGQIIGRPTLLAIFQQHLPVQDLLNRLRQIGYPMEDVAVYYRLKGTDQVIDATTGQVAAGQSITEAEIAANQLESAETLLLIHPEEEQVRSVEQMITTMGGADVKYSGRTERRGPPPGVDQVARIAQAVHESTPIPDAERAAGPKRPTGLLILVALNLLAAVGYTLLFFNRQGAPTTGEDAVGAFARWTPLISAILSVALAIGLWLLIKRVRKVATALYALAVIIGLAGLCTGGFNLLNIASLIVPIVALSILFNPDVTEAFETS
jgi:hypothetical protein